MSMRKFHNFLVNIHFYLSISEIIEQVKLRTSLWCKKQIRTGIINDSKDETHAAFCMGKDIKFNYQRVFSQLQASSS